MASATNSKNIQKINTATSSGINALIDQIHEKVLALLRRGTALKASIQSLTNSMQNGGPSLTLRQLDDIIQKVEAFKNAIRERLTNLHGKLEIDGEIGDLLKSIYLELERLKKAYADINKKDSGVGPNTVNTGVGSNNGIGSQAANIGTGPNRVNTGVGSNNGIGSQAANIGTGPNRVNTGVGSNNGTGSNGVNTGVGSNNGTGPNGVNTGVGSNNGTGPNRVNTGVGSNNGTGPNGVNTGVGSNNGEPAPAPPPAPEIPDHMTEQVKRDMEEMLNKVFNYYPYNLAFPLMGYIVRAARLVKAGKTPTSLKAYTDNAIALIMEKLNGVTKGTKAYKIDTILKGAQKYPETRKLLSYIHLLYFLDHSPANFKRNAKTLLFILRELDAPKEQVIDYEYGNEDIDPTNANVKSFRKKLTNTSRKFLANANNPYLVRGGARTRNKRRCGCGITFGGARKTKAKTKVNRKTKGKRH